MIKDANSFTTALSQHTSDPEMFVAELCKLTDVTNDGGTVSGTDGVMGDGKRKSTAHGSADCKTSRKRCHGELHDIFGHRRPINYRNFFLMYSMA